MCAQYNKVVRNVSHRKLGVLKIAKHNEIKILKNGILKIKGLDRDKLSVGSLYICWSIQRIRILHRMAWTRDWAGTDCTAQLFLSRATASAGADRLVQWFTQNFSDVRCLTFTWLKMLYCFKKRLYSFCNRVNKTCMLMYL